MNLPRGIWCVLSGLGAPELQQRGMAAAAAGAAALTLRRPACGAGAATRAFAGTACAGIWRATHGHADWALACGAQAVIAGSQSLGVGDYRRLHAGLLIGASVHGADEARRAQAAGADFLVAGPVWPTPQKEGIVQPLGLAGLSEIVALGLPVVAIGGMLTPEQVREAVRAGAHACAVLRAAAQPVELQALCRAAASATQS